MSLPFTATDGQGGGSFSRAYSCEVFLITWISAPNSFATRPAASLLNDQPLPIGSFSYSETIYFFMGLSSSFSGIGASFRHRTAGRRRDIFFIFLFQKIE